jgi:hypothetical protein
MIVIAGSGRAADAPLQAGASGLRDAIIRVLAFEPAKKSQP